MRWAELEETGVGSARIEIAVSTPRDEETRSARVVARAALADPTLVRPLYDLLEIQGLIDLHVCAPVALDGSPSSFVYWLVCADLSQRSARYGLSIDHFPKHYV